MPRSKTAARAVLGASVATGLAWGMATTLAQDGPRGPRGSGPFVNSGQSLAGETGNDVALGDLDNDGDRDAFVANDFSTFGNEANQVWVNDGQGVFTAGQTLGTSDGNAVALGDLDGDTDL